MLKRNSSRPKLDSQCPKQFIIKHTKRSNSTNRSHPSSLNTSQSSFRLLDDRNKPEDGKLLDLIIENENVQMSQVFNLQLTSFSLCDDQTQQKFAMSDDLNNPQLRRNLSYNWHYHQDLLMNLQTESVNLGACLKKQGVREGLRSKMVDWMLEVYGNYSQTTTHMTYFRAISLMDLFLKRTTQYFQDADLHLIGIGCMFIATKLEDIYHIPLNDFVKRVAHGKYTVQQIKQCEHTILEHLQYNILYPTLMDYLLHIYYRCFSLSDNPQLINIFDTCIYILKMCIHDYPMLTYPPQVLSSAVFGYAIKEYIETKYEGQRYDPKLQKQYQDTIIKICKVDVRDYSECVKAVNDLILGFKNKYPDLVNLEKFS